MLKLIQPKDGGCVTSEEKPSVVDKVENVPVTVNGNKDADHEGKTQHEKTEETNNVPSHAGITKYEPGNVSAPSAMARTSQSVNPGNPLGKLTYNPITHAPSMCKYICQHGFWISLYFSQSLTWQKTLTKFIWHFSYLHADGFVRSPSDPPHYYHPTATSRRQMEQATNGSTTLPPTEGTNGNVVSNTHHSSYSLFFSCLYIIYIDFHNSFHDVSMASDVFVASYTH